MSRASRWRTSGTVRASTAGRVGSVAGAGGELAPRSVVQIPVKKASANNTSVMCRYQPRNPRTS